MIKNHKLLQLWLGLALLISGLADLPVQADDTEVYVTPVGGGVQPNILFIIDTSGSMNDLEDVPVPYDPNTTYGGSCSTSRVYWSTDGKPPSCSSDNWFPVAANQCQASLASLQSTGFYSGVQAQQWRSPPLSPTLWDALNGSAHGSGNYVECAADAGKYGQGLDTSKPYADRKARDGMFTNDPPWTANAGNRITNWGNYTFYTGNYVNWYYATNNGTKQAKIDIVKDVATKLADSLSNVNIGLMQFDTTNSQNSSNNKGGPVIQPIGDITTNLTAFKNAVNSLSANGNTPLAETLYEATLYYRGMNVNFGNISTPKSVASSRVGGSANGVQYQTPITSQCQKNYVILLTDGQPTQDGDADSAIPTLPGYAQGSCKFATDRDGNLVSDCLPNVAQYLNQVDQSGQTGFQNVLTYTLGFYTGSNNTLLQQTATNGGGKFYYVDSYQSLQNALNQILLQVVSQNGLFTAPAVTVSAFNRLENLDQVYYALFKPTTSPRWPGNVKRYRFDANYLNTDGTTGAVVDVNGVPAVDPATGGFTPNAQSWWGSQPDGNDVLSGGVTQQLVLPRKVYTYTSSTTPNNADLTTTANAVSENNSVISKAMLGDANMSDTDYTNIRLWARGVDVLDENANGNTTEARPRMGDPLHSQPQLVTYGGTNASPDITLYVVTNEGFLHALNTSDGTEQFAFIPQELLANLNTLYQNVAGQGKVYGFDGPLSVRVINTGTMPILSSESDHVYLYGGLRRGGKSYYALDVTNRAAPKLGWAIKGGVTTTGTNPYAELGQTWSKATVSKIKVGSAIKNVLIMGGGYDPANDTKTGRGNDSQGRAVYIVDADTGALIWSGGTTDSSQETFTKTFGDMHYSIPSDVRVIDLNGDGLADQLYVGDMGGQLWRFDIANGQTGASLIKGSVILDVNGGNGAGNRMFFYPPSVALEKTNNGSFYLAVALGSGWRAHPLDTVVQDRFYVLRQPLGAPSSYTKYTEASLYDATSNDAGSTNATTQTTALQSLASTQGWYIRFTNSGEKVMGESLIANNQIMFTTYKPSASSVNACGGGSLGTGSFYVLNIFDATPTIRLDVGSSGTIASTASNRSKDLTRGGIPPSPVLYFPPGGAAPVVLVGPEKQPSGVTSTLLRTYWVERKQ